MKLMFWHAPQGNFGDDMNLWIWDMLLPGYTEWSEAVTLIGVGSLLGMSFELPKGLKLVVGSGAGYGKPPRLSPKEWDIRCVRGPLTAERLGLPREIGICDPAAMLCRQEKFAGIVPSGEVLFVPHWQSAAHPDFNWPEVCARAGISFQSPSEDAEAIVRRIAAARLVITESLHGAIVADAFRVPWHAAQTTVARFNAFKWQDFSDSVGLPLVVHNLMTPIDTPLQPLRRLHRVLGRVPDKQPLRRRQCKRLPNGSMQVWDRAKHALWSGVLAASLRRVARLAPQLSNKGVLDHNLDRYERALAGVVSDYGKFTSL